MSYLTYHCQRRRPWTEHANYPTGAVKWWNENPRYKRSPLLIYKISEDRTSMQLVDRCIDE